MMPTKKVFTKIGRIPHMEDDETHSIQSKIFKFKSGRSVEFFYKTIAANDVPDLTYVDRHNLRIGEELTKESLASIIESIRSNQFQPVIAQKVDDAYSILDGSRRRQAAIFAEVGLEMLYCNEALVKDEVKQVVKEITSSESFSLRDLGRYFSLLMNEDPTLKYDDIAEQEGYNKGIVSKALAAWTIPSDLIAMFPIPRNITYNQFNDLSKIVSKLSQEKMDLTDFVIGLVVDAAASNDDVFKVILDASKIKPKKDTNKPRKIIDVDAKKWVKIKSIGEKNVIELARIPKPEMEKIEKFIVELLSKKET